MPMSREKERAVRAANIAAGLRYDGKPRVPRVVTERRDHVAEVEAGLALGLDLDGIASDMGLKVDTVLKTLHRKKRVDLVRRLGVLSIADRAKITGARRMQDRG